MNYIKHFTWKEVGVEYGASKKSSQKILKDWNAKKVKDFTMTVEFYPGEVLDNDIEKIKLAVDDFNTHFPESKIEWDGEDDNMYIILDTIEKQLWGFFEVQDLNAAVKQLSILDKGEEGFGTIRNVTVNPDPGQEFIWIECYAGSSVKRYLKGLLKQTGLAQHLHKEMVFEDWGNEHCYSLEIKKESLQYFEKN